MACYTGIMTAELPVPGSPNPLHSWPGLSAAQARYIGRTVISPNMTIACVLDRTIPLRSLLALERKGFVRHDGDNWRLTPKGTKAAKAYRDWSTAEYVLDCVLERATRRGVVRREWVDWNAGPTTVTYYHEDTVIRAWDYEHGTYAAHEMHVALWVWDNRDRLNIGLPSLEGYPAEYLLELLSTEIEQA